MWQVQFLGEQVYLGFPWPSSVTCGAITASMLIKLSTTGHISNQILVMIK